MVKGWPGTPGIINATGRGCVIDAEEQQSVHGMLVARRANGLAGAIPSNYRDHCN